MTESDWIILRVLVASVRTKAMVDPDYVRSVVYLLRKYKSAVVFDCIKQLQDERDKP